MPAPLNSQEGSKDEISMEAVHQEETKAFLDGCRRQAEAESE
jgi:hypothetical protein